MQSTPGSDNFLRAEAELAIHEARKLKAERTKDLGAPITLTGKALALEVRDGCAWIAENTAVARKLDLETGRTLQLYKGHTAPVTALALYDSPDGLVLITGSWDKTIKLWNTSTKALISSTLAHADFVKILLVIPELKLLISGSSDKIVRFWDLTSFRDGQPLASCGSISSHTRPVETLVAHTLSNTAATLFTGDTMGIIKVWELERERGPAPRWRGNLQAELTHHRTRIDEMHYGAGELWTASSDETVQVHPYPSAPPSARLPAPIRHPHAVRCLLPLALSPLEEPYVITGAGDVIRAYDMSSPDEPELLGEVDAHWHDVTSLRLWLRRTTGDGGAAMIEPWVVSASLDGTIRKWRLSDLLKPPPPETVSHEAAKEAEAPAKDQPGDDLGLTEDEERELAELMGDD